MHTIVRMEEFMDIRDFVDLRKLQEIQDDLSDATGFAVVVLDKKGEKITRESNFSDFCKKYTLNSDEGRHRCQKCISNHSGIYDCHAGLIEFNIDIVLDNEKVGSVVGGQTLSRQPDEDTFKKTAMELGIDPEAYINALKKIPVNSDKSIRAAADLFGKMINIFINNEYSNNSNGGKLGQLQEEINHATSIIQKINTNTSSLKSIANKQKMLSLNASIEAARSGEAGVGFAVVAKSMGELSSQSATIYGDIEKSVIEVTDSIGKLASLFENS
ncbi:MAG TPA: chemotaxis protein [Lachnospiraceae bacterium]|nr:chemotaxis protein [Lachnospiraceae bacterium]